MRARLFRAMAHLKAAAMHVEEARKLVRGRWGEETATAVSISPLTGHITLARRVVEAQYAYQVSLAQQPAELPK